MRKKILMLILWLLPSVAAADTFFLENATTVGIDDKNATSIAELIRISFSEIARDEHRLVDMRKDAKYILKPKIVNLDGVYIVNLEKLEKETIIYASHIKAYEISELDVKILRLVRSVLNEGMPDPEVGEVANCEINEKVYRRQTVVRKNIGFGPSYGVNLNTKNMMATFSLGRSWEVNPSSSVRIFSEISTINDNTEKATFFTFGFGLNHFLTQEDNAPFILCDLGYGIGRANDDDDWEGSAKINGFVLGAGCGYTFFRSSLTNLEISFRYQALLGTNTEGMPGTAGLKICLLF